MPIQTRFGGLLREHRCYLDHQRTSIIRSKRGETQKEMKMKLLQQQQHEKTHTHTHTHHSNSTNYPCVFLNVNPIPNRICAHTNTCNSKNRHGFAVTPSKRLQRNYEMATLLKPEFRTLHDLPIASCVN